MTNPPTITRTWSIGNIVSVVTCILTLVSVIFAVSWRSSELNAKVEEVRLAIPPMKAQQDSNKTAITVLQTQMTNIEPKFAEIQRQYESISTKLDRLSEQKADKSATKEWTR